MSRFIPFPPLDEKIDIDDVVTFALGLCPRQGLTKVRAKNEA
jgi:hypothetical protein